MAYAFVQNTAGDSVLAPEQTKVQPPSQPMPKQSERYSVL